MIILKEDMSKTKCYVIVDNIHTYWRHQKKNISGQFKTLIKKLFPIFLFISPFLSGK